MAEGNEENRVDGVFGGVELEKEQLPVKQSRWSKFRNFLFQEIDWNTPIKIQLTPYQQKIEDEINEFLHQEISIKGFWNLITK